jgi:ABC-2 type transport system ATP-binding protein
MKRTGIISAADGGRDTAATAGAGVHLSCLRKNFGQVRAVDGVDLTIAPGEVVALLGPNGAGKSTTVDMILGLSTPDGGDVTVFGMLPAQAVAAGAIGAMPQGGALPDELTVGEMVGLVASLHRRPMPVASALRRAGVDDLAGRRGTKLSGGQDEGRGRPARGGERVAVTGFRGRCTALEGWRP